MTSKTTMTMTEEYPLQGVRLAALKQFIVDASETLKVDPATLTTADFCSKVVLKKTNDTKDALVNHFDQAKDVRPVATIFVSHAWTGLIIETIMAVEEQCGLAPDNQFVWLDCCSVNQHETQTKSAEWYSSTFHQAIQKIGYTCLVLTPIMSPTPLKRSWCLWELYGTIHTLTQLRICVPSSQKRVLIELMQQNFLQIMKNICSVDAAKAEAFYKIDQERIREAIETTVGIETINEAALDPLREWLLETASEAVASKPDAELLRGLGVLRFDLGKIDLAISSFQECINMRRERLASAQGADDLQRKQLELSLAGDLTNLGVCHFQKGESHEALRLYSESLGMRIRLKATKDLALSYNNKALALKSLRRYDEAFECFDWGLEAARSTGNVEDEENTQMNKAELMRETGKPKEAVLVLRKVLEYKKQSLGPEHIAVAQAMNLLGQSLLDLNELTEAENLFKESLRIRSRALGKYHPQVGLVVNNLAKLETMRGEIMEAKKRYEDLLILQREAFGPDHPFVKETERMMKQVLHQPQETTLESFLVNRDPVSLGNSSLGMALPRRSQPENVFQRFPANQAFSGMGLPQQRLFAREVSAARMIPPGPANDSDDNGDDDADGRYVLGREISAVMMIPPENESPTNPNDEDTVKKGAPTTSRGLNIGKVGKKQRKRCAIS